MNLVQQIFIFCTYFIGFLYVLVFFKLTSYAPKYLSILNTIYRVYLSLLLIFFFNPLTDTKFTNFHKQIAFSAGINLLGINTILSHLTSKKYTV